MATTDTSANDDAPATTSKDADVRSSAAPRDEGAVFGRTVTINKPRHEIYAFWRDFSNLPKVMENVASITVSGGGKQSHWVVEAPGGRSVEWDAIVTEDVPDQLIAWQSAEGADVVNSGRVEFRDAPPGRGTEVSATIAYDPPAGTVGKLIAKLFQKEPAIQARRDLRRLRQYLETGEIATSSPPNPAPTA